MNDRHGAPVLGSSEYPGLDAGDLAALIAAGQVSPVEVVTAALEQLDAMEPSTNAFSHVMRERALADAREAQRQLRVADRLPPLLGVPVSVKDLISVADEPWASGSRAFATNRATIDAPAVARLRAAGAIVIGKTTTSELGCKAVGDSPLTGATRSPWDLSMTAGGSSAGAAASVASGVTPIALGTDGGGSVRIPGALNGLFGIKAQFGRVPVYPFSATPELAHVGPLTRSVRDAAMVLQIIAGYDARDPGSQSARVPDFQRACEAGPRRLRIAWSPDFGHARPEPEVRDIAESAVHAFALWGCEIEIVDAPIGPDPAEAWSLIFYANVAARLGDVLDRDPGSLDPAVVPLLRCARSRSVLEYCGALAARRMLHERLRALFERFDVLASPTLPVASVPVGVDVPVGQGDRNLVTWASYTYPFNLSGHPAATLPAGVTSTGHPVGLQLVARPFAEIDLINLAAGFESARPWTAVAPLARRASQALEVPGGRQTI